MFCSKCGSEITEGAKFCEKCGANLTESDINAHSTTSSTEDSHKKFTDFFTQPAIDLSTATPTPPQRTHSTSGDSSHNNLSDSNFSEPADYNSVFIEPDEQLIATLGNGYFVNLLFHRAKTCSALLSDKRLYLKGAFYNGNNGNIMKTIEERIVDLEDITGTGFIYTRVSKVMVFWAILCLIVEIIIQIALVKPNQSVSPIIILAPLILFILFIVKALMSRGIWFFIDYASNRISINAKLIGLTDVQDFHKQIRRAKNASKSNNVSERNLL